MSYLEHLPPLADIPAVSPDAASYTVPPPASAAKGSAPAPCFEFHSPSHFINYKLPEDAILVGDCHLTRGDFIVIGGVPGCGKSRLLLSLAIAGRLGKGATWMGLPVQAPFRTAILQAENGEVRLQRELIDIHAQGHDLDGCLKVTAPPRYGLALQLPEFRSQMRDWLAEYRPGVFAIDPWNRCTADDRAKDYKAVIDNLLEILPDGPDRPAVVIVHHLRKRAPGEPRRHGRDLLPELSGSTLIGSSCRVAFILEPATPDPTDDRVVLTCPKNNNGEMGPATAWHRRNGLFAPCARFDWEEWNGEGTQARRKSVELEDLAAIFEDGERTLSRPEAAKVLEARLGLSRATAYRVLQTDGPFADYLSEAGGFLFFKP